jgi:putative tricarboxylic transport membrane protein
MDPVTAMPRFIFGQYHLMEGFDFISIAMGLFGLSDVFEGLEQTFNPDKLPPLGKLFPKKEEWRPTMGAIGRGTILGFLIGLIPGANSVIPTVLSYSIEKKISKTPDRFGNGALEGVAGPETSNNAYCGAALIPLFTMGIPTSPAIAILFGAFIMHGLTPGPALFDSQPTLLWAIIASMYIGNLVLLIFNLPLAGVWGRIALIPPKFLYPAIVVISVLGAYTVSGSLWDVGVMLGFGILGYVFKKLDIPMAPIVLTFVLGKLMESTFSQSMLYFRGNVLGFFMRPISGIILSLALALFIYSVVSAVLNRRKAVAEDMEV